MSEFLAFLQLGGDLARGHGLGGRTLSAMMRTGPSRIGVLACAVASLACPAIANAHEIHTTLTVLTRSTNGVTINIRTFADDFSESVAKFARKPAPADSSAPLPDVQRYVRAHFAIRDGDGRMLPLETCGVRRAAELYWLCFRAPLASGAVRGTYIRNQMLTELHADQVNIVQVDEKGARRTVMFTKTSAPALLSPGA